LAWFQNYASNSNIKGFYIQMYLSQFETGTTPVYSYTSQSGGVNYGGFAMVDYYLGLCEQYGKRLALEFETVGFGSNPLPAYWQAQNWFFINDTAYRTNTGIAACNNRLIALVQAYGARYNSHPRLEVVGFEETTVNLGTAGVSESTWINNYKALLSASVAAFPNTLVRNNENGQTSHATTKTIYEHVETLNNAGVGCVICGGPDFENGLFPPNTPYSPGSPKGWKQLWRGQTTSQGVTWKDVRGVHPFWGECQDRRYNSAYPSQLPVDSAADVCTYQIDFMRASHVTFNNYAKWTETLAAINARSGLTVTTPPSCLSGRTVTEGTGQEEIVVVTGSSTISLWSTIQSDFAPQTVIKKGVSGTTVADLQANLSSLVLQYSPTKVGIYQGDNDIAGGVTPAAFISTYRQVLQAINAQFPSCRCYAISIKPSPARTAYWETMQEANALLAAMCNEDSRWNYINASDVLLSGGVPVTAYFDPSGSPAYLHLSSAGYAVWAPVVVSGMGL
jgi:lysophospholipase L1-like esterase